MNKPTSFRETFIKYVEVQHNAESWLRMLGPTDSRTVQAFLDANILKNYLMNNLPD